MNHLNIKVCGLTRWEDMAQLEDLGVQYGGMIFYEKSPRFAEGKSDAEKIKRLSKIKKVGVFVNAGADYILQQKEKYGLDLIQLHGEETPEFCRAIKQYLPVIKAFRIKEANDLIQLETYKLYCNYFLFDTPGKLYGGSGKLFEWDLLKNYNAEVPFFISGGIGISETAQLKAFSHPALFAVDVNSRFEISPGEKNIDEIKQFLCHLNSD